MAIPAQAVALLILSSGDWSGGLNRRQHHTVTMVIVVMMMTIVTTTIMRMIITKLTVIMMTGTEAMRIQFSLLCLVSTPKYLVHFKLGVQIPFV